MNKVGKTPGELVQLLIARGMDIADPGVAERFFSRVNYYKFKAYLFKYEVPCPYLDHRFSRAVTFEEVYQVYKFDRKLRIVIGDMLERLEVAVRTKWAQEMALRFGPFAHEASQNFQRADFHSRSLTQLRESYQKSQERFARHYRSQYPAMNTPYIWVSIEMMSFGQISRWLNNTRNPGVRRAVAQSFGLGQRFFESYLHRASDVRNICSHHQRLWNRRLPSPVPQLLQNHTSLDVGLLQAIEPDRLYNVLVVLNFIADQISPGHRWTQRLVDLLSEDESRVAHMGFPGSWRKAFPT